MKETSFSSYARFIYLPPYFPPPPQEQSEHPSRADIDNHFVVVVLPLNHPILPSQQKTKPTPSQAPAPRRPRARALRQHPRLFPERKVSTTPSVMREKKERKKERKLGFIYPFPVAQGCIRRPIVFRVLFFLEGGFFFLGWGS